MKQYKMAAIVLVFLMLMSATASGVMAGVGDSGAIETDEEYQGICLDIGKNIEYSSPMVFTTTDLTTIRQRPIEMHSAFYDAMLFQENISITLNLFDDVTIISTINTRVEYILGITGLLGDVEGSEWGYVALSLGFETVYGTIEIPENNQRFIIHHDSDTEMHYVSEVDVFYSDEDEPQRYAPTLILDVQSSLGEELLSLEPAFNPDPWEEVTIKMGVYFTEQASEQAGGVGQIANKIANEFTVSNTILSNSQTYLTLEWVDTKMVTYAETGDYETDLGALRLGEIDNIATRREDCSLDLVSLIVKECDVNGAAYTLREVDNGRGWPTLGFSLVKQDRLGGNKYTFMHEIGHNLGCHHHPDDSPQEGPTDWIDWEAHFGEDNDWSAGHRWWRTLWGHQTVMCWPKGGYTRIPHFSNPDVSYEGYSTGTANHNNARTIRTTKHIVATYSNSVLIYATQGGTTSPEPDRYNWPRGIRSIMAVSDPGWSFSHWSGDVPAGDRYENWIDLYVDGDKSLTAHFVDDIAPSFSDFQPSGWWSTDQTPHCSILISDHGTGVDISSVQYSYSLNGGSTWSSWTPVDDCYGWGWPPNEYARATVYDVPFNQDSIDQNRIKFRAMDIPGNLGYSDYYTVKIDATPPATPQSPHQPTPRASGRAITILLSPGLLSQTYLELNIITCGTTIRGLSRHLPVQTFWAQRFHSPTNRTGNGTCMPGQGTVPATGAGRTTTARC